MYIKAQLSLSLSLVAIINIVRHTHIGDHGNADNEEDDAEHQQAVLLVLSQKGGEGVLQRGEHPLNHANL